MTWTERVGVTRRQEDANLFNWCFVLPYARTTTGIIPSVLEVRRLTWTLHLRPRPRPGFVGSSWVRQRFDRGFLFEVGGQSSELNTLVLPFRVGGLWARCTTASTLNSNPLGSKSCGTLNFSPKPLNPLTVSRSNYKPHFPTSGACLQTLKFPTCYFKSPSPGRRITLAPETMQLGFSLGLRFGGFYGFGGSFR